MKLLSIVRPINLIIIALNIVVVDFFICPQGPFDSKEFFVELLKVLVMVLLAAGGNMINDYFDQKTDALNKPKEQLIGKIISPKRVILLHLVITSLAVVLALVLTLLTHQFFYACVALMYAIVLYLYTPFFKRIPILGNAVIAACVGFLPYWTAYGCEFMTTDGRQKVAWLMVFAFVSNFIREWVKDVQDVQGDTAQGYRTAAVRWGFQSSKRALYFLWWLQIVLCSLYCWNHPSVWTSAMVFAPSFFGGVPLWIATKNQDFKRISLLLKMIMVLGMLGIIFS
jgi:4-hydroxybenzoate polyprenyltransferase